jgi:hypothetical protein
MSHAAISISKKHLHSSSSLYRDYKRLIGMNMHNIHVKILNLKPGGRDHDHDRTQAMMHHHCINTLFPSLSATDRTICPRNVTEW